MQRLEPGARKLALRVLRGGWHSDAPYSSDLNRLDSRHESYTVTRQPCSFEKIEHVKIKPVVQLEANGRREKMPKTKSTLIVNGKTYEVGVSPDVPLLWVIREHLKLTGTKFGCGIAQCGACTVHLEGKAVRSCSVPVGDAFGKRVTTIEGIPSDHPVKRAWVQRQVPQCGYCQPGQIMQAIAVLNENPKIIREKVVQAMAGNLCRCGTYPRILEAIDIALATSVQE